MYAAFGKADKLNGLGGPGKMSKSLLFEDSDSSSPQSGAGKTAIEGHFYNLNLKKPILKGTLITKHSFKL